MAGMAFGASSESTWIVPGWAFRQVLDDLRRRFVQSEALDAALSEAEDIGRTESSS